MAEDADLRDEPPRRRLCPSASFCIATDDAGRVITTTNPAGRVDRPDGRGRAQAPGASRARRRRCASPSTRLATPCGRRSDRRGVDGHEHRQHARAEGHLVSVGLRCASPWTGGYVASVPRTRPAARRRGARHATYARARSDVGLVRLDVAVRRRRPAGGVLVSTNPNGGPRPGPASRSTSTTSSRASGASPARPTTFCAALDSAAKVYTTTAPRRSPRCGPTPELEGVLGADLSCLSSTLLRWASTPAFRPSPPRSRPGRERMGGARRRHPRPTWSPSTACRRPLRRDQRDRLGDRSSAAGPKTLTVAKAGTGTGTVTSAPAGIACGATCSATFDGRHEDHAHGHPRGRLALRGLERGLLGHRRRAGRADRGAAPSRRRSSPRPSLTVTKSRQRHRHRHERSGRDQLRRDLQRRLRRRDDGHADRGRDQRVGRSPAGRARAPARHVRGHAERGQGRHRDLRPPARAHHRHARRLGQRPGHEPGRHRLR